MHSPSGEHARSAGQSRIRKNASLLGRTRFWLGFWFAACLFAEKRLIASTEQAQQRRPFRWLIYSTASALKSPEMAHCERFENKRERFENEQSWACEKDLHWP
jgi:hypothetical protein